MGDVLSVTLREVRESDLPVFFDQQNEREGFEMAVFKPRKRKAFMAHWKKILSEPDKLARAVIADGEVAGHVATFEQSGRRLVGYWIGKAYWNRGIATLALRDLVANHEHTRPLFAWVAKTNVGSIRVLEKCGFETIGEHNDGGIVEIEMRLL